MTAVDYKALAAKAVAAGADQTKAVVGGGGDYTPPAAGPGYARFIGYLEVGKHTQKMKGVPQTKEKVQLIFELVGKRHAVEEGQQPHRITIEENYSLNEKANFFKLFQRMNYKQDAQHICALLGDGFKVTVVHDKWTGKDGKEHVTPVLRDASGTYTIEPPRKEDEDSETGWVAVDVPMHKSAIRCFLWDHCDLDMWASLFIEGEYPERKDKDGKVTAKAKSKNVLQEKIKQAVNFQGSPIYNLLAAAGQSLDIPEMDEQDDPGNTAGSATPAPSALASTTSPSNDALGGIV